MPFRQVSLGDWRPKVGDCHANVNIWVKANPGTTAVRGWVTYASFGIAIGLTAHSVVRDTDPRLIDITPLENEHNRSSMRFVPHLGDEDVFFAVLKMDICINCPQ